MYIRLTRILMLATLASACATRPTYQPGTPVEAGFYAKADRATTPKQVAARFEAYKDSQVAWAGIVRSRKVTPVAKTKGDFEVEVLVEHRFFDWNEYLSPKKREETFLLSPISGGNIRVVGRYTRPSGSKQLPAQELSPGTMVVLYGQPERVERNNVILLNSGYVRPIDKTHYSVRASDVNPMR